MRRMLVWVPQGSGGAVAQAAHRNGCEQTLRLAAEADGDPVDLLVLQLPNAKVEPLVADLDRIGGLHVSMLPRGVLALQPPASATPQHVVDVTWRSPLEVFLGGLQSIGSWRGFLAYAVVSGLVVWVGLFTDTVFLLTAAMLIAPFAGPAMTAALGTARGDWPLLRRSLARYAAALGAAIATAAVMSAAFRQEIPTEQMVAAASVSTAAVVLPLAAGAAGAITLGQSERSSLVSGAATGMLVAASLAPPAGMVGMSSVLGNWGMVGNGLFLLALQLLGINLSATIVFRLMGLRASGARYPRGREWVYRVVTPATVVLLAGMLAWQFTASPALQRATLAQRAAATVAGVLDDTPAASLVEVSARFAGVGDAGTDTLLVTAFAQAPPGTPGGGSSLERRLSRHIRRQLESSLPGVTPLVSVTVLEAPAAGSR